MSKLKDYIKDVGGKPTGDISINGNKVYWKEGDLYYESTIGLDNKSLTGSTQISAITWVPDELEERIITNKSEIPNAKKYIEQIHVLITGDMPDYIAENMIELRKYIDDVDIYFYNEEKYFNNQATWGASMVPKHLLKDAKWTKDVDEVDFEKDLDKDKIPYTNYRIPLTRIMGLMIIGDDELKGKLYKWLGESKYVEKVLADRNRQFKGTNSELTIDNLYKLIEKESKKDIDNYVKYITDFYLHDYVAALSADIHNHKSSTNPIARYALQKLTKDMSKHKVKNLKSYIEYKNKLIN